MGDYGRVMWGAWLWMCDNVSWVCAECYGAVRSRTEYVKDRKWNAKCMRKRWPLATWCYATNNAERSRQWKQWVLSMCGWLRTCDVGRVMINCGRKRKEEDEMVTFSNTVLSHGRSKMMKETEKRSLAGYQTEGKRCGRLFFFIANVQRCV